MKRKQVAASHERALVERPALELIARSNGGAPVVPPQEDAARTERIREAAYRLYEARGHEDGHDVEDWLAAEASLSAQPAAGTAAAEATQR